MVKKLIAQRNGFPEGVTINEDVATIFRWFYDSQYVYLSEKPLVNYLVREGSAINTLNFEKGVSIMKAAKVIKKELFRMNMEYLYEQYYLLHVELGLYRRMPREVLKELALDHEIERYNLIGLLSSFHFPSIKKGIALLFYRQKLNQ